MAYIDKYNIDISSWSIAKFRYALDFNLNKKYNLNNVLIFTKFYTMLYE